MTSKAHKPNHLMLFDLEVGGHHAGYIRHLLHYWPSKRDSVPAGFAFHELMRISVVVSPEFMRKHLDVVNNITTAANVEWVAISEAELSWYRASFGSLVKRAYVEWRLFCRYAKRLGANQALIMYLDRFQLPLALQLPVPCDLSGIYFRPTFHYQTFLGYNPSLKDRFRAWRQSLLWRLACRHPRLKVLFSLDPLAVEPLQRLGKISCPLGANVVHLPDPVEGYPKETDSRTTNELRDELGIEVGRRVFLLFGMLDARKGIYQLLDALRLLPAQTAAQLSLLLVGPLVKADEANDALPSEHPIKPKIDSISRSEPVQIILHNQFITDEQIQPYFDIADVILAPYQRHVGMSAILVRAAAAGKPLLASTYGLMGELVRQRSLGITVDSTQASEIAKGVSAFLEGKPTEMFDSQSAAEFAGENSAEGFAGVVWDALGLVPSSLLE
jgi:glycosyltransferase involved in cell wall biosynthesis